LNWQREILYEVVPEAGSALIFPQYHKDYLHEGAKLMNGTKYILRTDIMYDLEK
jgi:hypothetical protein